MGSISFLEISFEMPLFKTSLAKKKKNKGGSPYLDHKWSNQPNKTTINSDRKIANKENEPQKPFMKTKIA